MKNSPETTSGIFIAEPTCLLPLQRFGATGMQLKSYAALDDKHDGIFLQGLVGVLVEVIKR